MRGRWKISQEERDKYIPYIKDCIKKLEASEEEEISLNDTTLNPENVKIILRELGYSQNDFDSNGWDYDFWYTFVKEEKRAIILSGTGATFDLKIYLDDK